MIKAKIQDKVKFLDIDKDNEKDKDKDKDKNKNRIKGEADLIFYIFR